MTSKLLIAVLASMLGCAAGFTTCSTRTSTERLWQQRAGCRAYLSAASTTSSGPTLTESTIWQLRLKINNLELAKSSVGIEDRIFNLRLNFLEEEGYEPPQGTVRQVAMSNDDSSSKDELVITKARWMLSEDPEDRKDGLWVWGLFKEPLYPFLLLTMETAEKILDEESKTVLPPLKFYAQIPHTRKDGAVSLDSAVLNVRNTEQLQLVGAVADYFEDVGVGQLQINPLL
mmetsp:Transcript_6183/g.9012  ORF Transcript_6183/g.9012 Transcript_6183/m.9012 type:complete len:230 (+) Transcript_6183:75-764(+)